MYYFAPFKPQVVFVDATGVVSDPDTGEVFDDLSPAFLADSDEWFAYESDPRQLRADQL